MKNEGPMSDLERIDNNTPKYKFLLEKKLSVLERKVVVGIVRALDSFRSFSVAEIRPYTRIQQQNLLSALLTRLVGKSIIVREKRGIYRIVDPELFIHINARCNGRF